jgi:hypothetical protein
MAPSGWIAACAKALDAAGDHIIVMFCDLWPPWKAVGFDHIARSLEYFFAAQPRQETPNEF